MSQAGRLFFYESSAFRDAANAGKARRARSVFCRIVFRAEPVRRTCGHEDRDAVSQETCHPSGHSAQGEMLPDASTEVVVAYTLSCARAAHASASYGRFGPKGFVVRGLIE